MEQEKSHQSNLRYVHEATVGLNPARNRGWQEARTPFLAYLDDDAVPSAEWLSAILSAFEECSPSPACVGGSVRLKWETVRPPWLSDDHLVYFTVVGHTAAEYITDPIRSRQLVGANFAFRRSVLEQIGGFQEGLDRIGACLLSGGDILIQQQILDAGFFIYYEPQALVDHYVCPERVTQKWLATRAYWGGYSNTLLELYRSRSRLKTLRLVLWHLRQLLLSPSMLIAILRTRHTQTSFLKKTKANEHVGGVLAAQLLLGGAVPILKESS